MNIFFLHLDPKTCAAYYFNKHCVKIILEIAQMLYTAHWMTATTTEPDWSHHLDGLAPYRKTHANHPTARWVRQCRANYIFTCSMGLALCAEYTARYGKVHKCQVRLQWLLEHLPASFDASPIPATLATVNIPAGCTPVPLAMPDEYHSTDLLYSYRSYYLFGKSHIPTADDRVRLETFKRDITVLATVVSPTK